MKNNYRKWNIAILLASLVIPCMVIGINYLMDPFWCFSISHKYNQVQEIINERVQKTNYLTFRDAKYQAILIGTSRSTCINQHSFKGISVFNYSCNGLGLQEYVDYLKYAKQRCGGTVKYIFLGLDFGQTMGGAETQPLMATAGNEGSMDPGQMISRAASPLHRVKTLLSVDSLKYSLRNYDHYRKIPKYYYTRDNVKMIAGFTHQELDGIFGLYLDYYDKKWFPGYRYNDAFVKMLKKIKEGNKDATIIVYTTPDCDPLMKAFVKHGLLDYYFRWLSDIVSVFGGCYNFMYPSMITRNYYDYFHDTNHTNPNVGDMIADRICNDKQHADHDFGMYIDEYNFTARKKVLEELFRKL
jgi:hypothetical protein